MKLLSHLIATLFLPVALAAAAHAQTVYRCGNSYSQQPCPGGGAIDASDKRTPEQRQAQEASAQHERRTADALEKSRQRDEAAAARAAEQADKAERAAAAKLAQKSTPAKTKKHPAKDKLPAYRAPVTPKQ